MYRCPVSIMRSGGPAAHMSSALRRTVTKAYQSDMPHNHSQIQQAHDTVTGAACDWQVFFVPAESGWSKPAQMYTKRITKSPGNRDPLSNGYVTG